MIIKLSDAEVTMLLLVLGHIDNLRGLNAQLKKVGEDFYYRLHAAEQQKDCVGYYERLKELYELVAWWQECQECWHWIRDRHTHEHPQWENWLFVSQLLREARRAVLEWRLYEMQGVITEFVVYPKPVWTDNFTPPTEDYEDEPAQE